MSGIGDALLVPAYNDHYAMRQAGAAAAASTLLLDVVSVPANYAYSCYRKLRAAYGGPAITVRRTDNVEQDIGYAGDFVDTAALLTFAAGTSAWVKTFYDNSVNARHLQNLTTTQQPRVVNAGALETMGASRPAMLFDGVDDKLQGVGPGLSGSPDITVGNAVHCLNAGNSFAWAFGPGVNVNNTRMTFDRTGSGLSIIYKEHNGSGIAFVPLLDPGTAARYYVMQHPAGGTVVSGGMRQNGVALATSSPVGSAVLGLVDGVTVLGDLTLGGFPMQCRQNFFAVFNSFFAGANLAAFEAELALHI